MSASKIFWSGAEEVEKENKKQRRNEMVSVNRRRGQALLSPKQREEVFRMVVEGFTDQDIAEDFSLHSKQIKKMRQNYRQRINEIRKKYEERQAREEALGLAEPIVEALRILGWRASYKNKKFHLDNRVVPLRNLMKEANQLQQRRGAKQIYYPGVRPLPDHGGPAMQLRV